MNAEQNPYASPTATDDDVVDDSILVDGELFVVGSSATLPRRCVVTNESVDESGLVEDRLTWSPSFRLVLRHQRCDVQYYLSPRGRKRPRRRMISAIRYLFFVLPLIAFFFLFFGTSLPVVIGTFSGVLTSLVPSKRQSKLSIVRYRNGRFWIAGCCPEFLAELSEGSPHSDM